MHGSSAGRRLSAKTRARVARRARTARLGLLARLEIVRVGIVVALMLLAGCWTGSGARTEAPAPALPRTGPSLEISLEHGPCFGRCPVYKVTIGDDGRVAWLGGSDVAAAGARTRRITPADLDALDRELDAARFFERDRFGRLPREPICVTRGSVRSCTFPSETICSHTSRTILTVRRGHRAHRVENAHCSDEDAALAVLERRILERAGVAAWIGR